MYDNLQTDGLIEGVALREAMITNHSFILDHAKMMPIRCGGFSQEQITYVVFNS